ncbi:hypothetical protein ACP70R_049103 [Stipagrostis hirtigluma subsp. patula]
MATISVPVVSGAPTQLPAGFKFRPSDQDIIVHYLRRRAVNEPLPSAIISDVDILAHNPWDLIPEGAMEKYVFTQRVLKWPQGKRCKRAAGQGFWKASGREVPIFCSGNSSGIPLMVGLKKTMVFYRGKPLVGEHTEWVMHEFRLSGAGLMPYRVMRPERSNDLGQCSSTAATTTKKNDDLAETPRGAAASLPMVPVLVNPDDSWVICRIFKKKKHTMPLVIPQDNRVVEDGHLPFYDFLGQGNPEGTASTSSFTNPPLDNTMVNEDVSTGEGK